MADEPDTRSSPGAGTGAGGGAGAGTRYEDAPAECTSTLANPKNNGYERSASANEDMERLSNDQGAEGSFFFVLNIPSSSDTRTPEN